MPAEKELCTRSEQAFSSRGSVLSLWQDIAENFYPVTVIFLSPRARGRKSDGIATTSFFRKTVV